MDSKTLPTAQILQATTPVKEFNLTRTWRGSRADGRARIILNSVINSTVSTTTYRNITMYPSSSTLSDLTSGKAPSGLEATAIWGRSSLSKAIARGQMDTSTFLTMVPADEPLALIILSSSRIQQPSPG